MVARCNGMRATDPVFCSVRFGRDTSRVSVRYELYYESIGLSRLKLLRHRSNATGIFSLATKQA